MKINGLTDIRPQAKSIVFPREDDEGNEYFIEIKAGVILNHDAFDAIYPEPIAPTKMYPSGVTEQDFEDKQYLEDITTKAERQIHWMVLESLKATDGIEWEKVKYNDPDTWELYKEELADIGFLPTEILQITTLVVKANIITESRMDEAKRRFLALKRDQEQEQSSPNIVPLSTESGEPVNA